MVSLFSVIVGFRFTQKALNFNARSLERSNAIANAANYHYAIEFQKDTWLALLLTDPDSEQLLAWHLTKRGLPSNSHLENKKVLFYLLRLDVYEELLLAHRKQLLDEETINGWIEAIHRDANDPEFAAMWNHVSRFYAKALKQEFDEAMRAKCASQDSQA